MIKIKELWEKNNCYNNGSYYNTLLPEYSWEGLSDTNYLNQYLSSVLKKKGHTTLELAAGTGRATKILEEYSKLIDAVEPSIDMITSFGLHPDSVNLINNTSEGFLEKAQLKKYDLIFSFWGPYPDAHSTELLLKKISSGTRGIFFHANRGCYEQKFIRTVLHLFKDSNYNPNINTSKKEDAFVNALNSHCSSRNIDFSIEEITGEVKYKSLDFALESFLNLHFAGAFEKEAYLKVGDFVYEQLKQNVYSSGEIRLKSGIKVINLIKQ